MRNRIVLATLFVCCLLATANVHGDNVIEVWGYQVEGKYIIHPIDQAVEITAGSVHPFWIEAYDSVTNEPGYINSIFVREDVTGYVKIQIRANTSQGRTYGAQYVRKIDLSEAESGKGHLSYIKITGDLGDGGGVDVTVDLISGINSVGGDLEGAISTDTFETEFTFGGSVNYGINVAEDMSADLTIDGDLDADLDVNGSMTGVLEIKGDMTGSIDIAGGLTDEI